MKTIVIIGGTREAAYNRLRRIAPDDGIVRQDWYDEVEKDGTRIIAIGGGPGDVCWLRGVGLDVEIITVEDEAISEEMWRRINTVRSTHTVYYYVGGKRRERQLR